MISIWEIARVLIGNTSWRHYCLLPVPQCIAAFLFVPRLKHNQEINLSLAENRKNLCCLSVVCYGTRWMPHSFTKQSHVVSWDTWQSWWAATTGDGSGKSCLGCNCPELLVVGLLHPKCQEQTAGLCWTGEHWGGEKSVSRCSLLCCTTGFVSSKVLCCKTSALTSTGWP